MRRVCILTGPAVRRRAGLQKSRTGQPQARINDCFARRHRSFDRGRRRTVGGTGPLIAQIRPSRANYNTPRDIIIRSLHAHVHTRAHAYNNDRVRQQACGDSEGRREYTRRIAVAENAGLRYYTACVIDTQAPPRLFTREFNRTRTRQQLFAEHLQGRQ